jgi:hypothetical protein
MQKSCRMGLCVLFLPKKPILHKTIPPKKLEIDAGFFDELGGSGGPKTKCRIF